MVTVVRAGTALLLAAAALLFVAAPAQAHTRAAAASEFDSRITATPPAEGIAWRTYAGGDLIEVSVSGDVELVVAGYEGEPFLRISPDGVFTNRNSPATYLNAERYGDVALPPRADAAAAPEWRLVTSRPTYAWHDHRVHWMSPLPPAAVAAAPGTAQLLQRWTVEVTVDGQEHDLAGELWWVPGGTPLPWFALALVLTAPAVSGVARLRRNGLVGAAGDSTGRLALTRRGLRPAAAVVAAVAAVNLLHFADELAAWPAPGLDVAFGVLHTALFVGAALAGAVMAWRATQGPFFALGIASGALLFHQGILQWPLLGASQLPTVWPLPAVRLAVALSLAQAVWVAVALVVGMRAAGRAADSGTVEGAVAAGSSPAPVGARAAAAVVSPHRTTP